MSLRGRWSKRLLAGSLALGVVAAGAVAVWQRQQELEAAPRYGERPVPVRVSRAERTDFVRRREYLAEVEPVRSARVAAKVTAPVTAIRVDEGSRVKEGDVLATLEAEEVRAERRSIEAEIASVRAEREAEKANLEALRSSEAYWRKEKKRVGALAERKAVSRSEADRVADRHNEVKGRLKAAKRKVEALTGRIESLRARKEQLSARLADYTIRAPFPGVVADRHIDLGDQAAPGKTLFELDGRDGLRLAFDVPQSDLHSLRPDQPVRYRVDGESRRASIDRIHPRLDAARLARVEVEVPEAGGELTPGACLPVTVALQRIPGAVVVPARAVAESPTGKPHVFAVENGRIRPRPVTVRARSGKRVAVQGIEPATQVTLSTYLGWTRLASGQSVTVRR